MQNFKLPYERTFRVRVTVRVTVKGSLGRGFVVSARIRVQCSGSGSSSGFS